MITREIEGHGTFSAKEEHYAAAMKMSRKYLILCVLDIYDGVSGDGAKARHWRKFRKHTLALIVASENPSAVTGKVEP